MVTTYICQIQDVMSLIERYHGSLFHILSTTYTTQNKESQLIINIVGKS